MFNTLPLDLQSEKSDPENQTNEHEHGLSF